MSPGESGAVKEEIMVATLAQQTTVRVLNCLTEKEAVSLLGEMTRNRSMRTWCLQTTIEKTADGYELYVTGATRDQALLGQGYVTAIFDAKNP
jgi:hypothetical protein